MSIYGYIRVSTDKQEYERQLYCLRDLGIPKENIFEEKVSGKKEALTREIFDMLTNKLKQGDVIYFESISRLGRNLSDILAMLKYLTKKKKVTIETIAEHIKIEPEVKLSASDNLKKNIAGTIAEYERDINSERTKDGIAAKRAELGAAFKIGRPKKYNNKHIKRVKELYYDNCYTIMQIAEMMSMSKSAVGRFVKEDK